MLLEKITKNKIKKDVHEKKQTQSKNKTKNNSKKENLLYKKKLYVMYIYFFLWCVALCAAKIKLKKFRARYNVKI